MHIPSKGNFPKPLLYSDVLKIVAKPRSCIDADGNFVDYDVIQDQLDSYRRDYDITEGEYQQLTHRLQAEKDADPNPDK